jgi:hypothetical protein
VVTVLATLPRLAAAFDASELSWTQLRILVTVATPATEAHWLELARGRTVRALEALVREARAATGTAETSAAIAADDAVVEGEAIVRFDLRCPRRVRRLWSRVVELARRMIGADGPVWQAAEVVAAEGLAAPEAGSDASTPAVADAGTGGHAIQDDRGDDLGNPVRPPVWGCLDWSAVRAAIPADIEALGHACSELDAFELDTRLRKVLKAQRAIDWQLGRLLHTLLRLRLERLMGFPSMATYARERLGLSPSKVRGLVAIERKTWEVPAFGAAYEAGELSWVRALVLVPVLAERTASAWTARAQVVTVRRLVAEVEWSLDRRDATAAAAVPPGPPPAGHDIAADVAAVERQMRARSEWSPADTDISFTGPASVVALLQRAIGAFRRPGDPRWAAFERLLQHVAGEWEAQPKHRDPIFDREGWRCAVPACTARRNLHDHHLLFRSHGGGNERENRIAVCAWHHLRALHAGLVRASGTAPAGVRWELGLRAGQPPLLSFVGDTYVDAQDAQRIASRQGMEDTMAA